MSTSSGEAADVGESVVEDWGRQLEFLAKDMRYGTCLTRM